MDKQKWVRTLTRQLGVHTPIPDELLRAADAAAGIRDINRLVFAWAEAIPKVVVNIDPALSEMLDGFGYENKAARAVKNQATTLMTEHMTYVNAAVDRLLKYADKDREYQHLLGLPEVPVSEMLAQVTDPWWTLLQTQTQTDTVTNNEPTLVFQSSDCVMRHTVPTTSDAKEINLGKFIVRVKPYTMQVFGNALEGNTFARDIAHPHCSGAAGGKSGTICLGNGAQIVLDAFAEKRIDKVLTIVRTVLTTYGENPYRQFMEYYREQNPPGADEPYELRGDGYLRVWVDELGDKKLLREHLHEDHMDPVEDSEETYDGENREYWVVRCYKKQYTSIGYTSTQPYVKLHRGELHAVEEIRRW